MSQELVGGDVDDTRGRVSFSRRFPRTPSGRRDLDGFELFVSKNTNATRRMGRPVCAEKRVPASHWQIRVCPRTSCIESRWNKSEFLRFLPPGPQGGGASLSVQAGPPRPSGSRGLTALGLSPFSSALSPHQQCAWPEIDRLPPFRSAGGLRSPTCRGATRPVPYGTCRRSGKCRGGGLKKRRRARRWRREGN